MNLKFVNLKNTYPVTVASVQVGDSDPPKSLRNFLHSKMCIPAPTLALFSLKEQLINDILVHWSLLLYRLKRSLSAWPQLILTLPPDLLAVFLLKLLCDTETLKRVKNLVKVSCKLLSETVSISMPPPSLPTLS